MSKPDWGHGPNEPVPVWDLSAVTRVDVVDQDGVHEFWGDRWEIHLQDDGRTLKLIQKDGYGAAARAIRDVALAKDSAKASPWMPMPPDGRGPIASHPRQLPTDVERMIGVHIDDLLLAQEKSREFQRKTRYFTEAVHWRDIVLFVTTLLFAVIIWHGDHHRPVWLPLLIATIVMSVVTGIEVLRGFLTAVRPAQCGNDVTVSRRVFHPTQVPPHCA